VFQRSLPSNEQSDASIYAAGLGDFLCTVDGALLGAVDVALLGALSIVFHEQQ
jgi:hypothetical protein